MSNIPYITLQDKLNTALLESDKIPALIVEGSTDYFVYGRLMTLTTISEEFDIVVAGCKTEAFQEYDKGIPFKHVVLVDSDYDRLTGSCRTADNIVYTHFYEMENYLTLEQVLDITMRGYHTIHVKPKTTTDILDEVARAIRPLIIASYLKLSWGWGVKLEACGLERWWDRLNCHIDVDKMKTYMLAELNTLGTSISEARWDELYAEADGRLPHGNCKELDTLVKGRHKLRATHYVCTRHLNLPREFTPKVFRLELSKNIVHSVDAQQLVQKIDNAFSLTASN